MDFERVSKLAGLMEEKGLTGLEIWEGESRVILSRASAPMGQMQTPALTVPIQAAQEVSESGALPSKIDENALKSPLVGCVYLSPTPGAAPFVSVGSHIKKGQVLCIIEAMKVMNEFTAARDGVIAEVCVENGQLVEFGQPMFCLK